MFTTSIFEPSKTLRGKLMKVIQKYILGLRLKGLISENRTFEKPLWVYSQRKDVQRTAISQWQTVFNVSCIITAKSDAVITVLNALRAADMQTVRKCSVLVRLCVTLQKKGWTRSKKRRTDTMSQTYQTLWAYCLLDKSQVWWGGNQVTDLLIYTFPAEASCPWELYVMLRTLLVFKWGGGQNAE